MSQDNLMADQEPGTSVTYISRPLFAEMEDLVPPQQVTVTRPPAPVKMNANGRVLRDAALEKVWSATPESWRAMALDVLYQLARRRERFTTDELWDALPVKPPGSHSVIGALIHMALAQRIIERSGQTVKTRRPSAKARDIPIYNSLVYAR